MVVIGDLDTDDEDDAKDAAAAGAGVAEWSMP
jgi:hypothetical protein